MSDATGLTAARWVKSTRSGPTGGNCVEVACLGDGRVAVRNSRHPAGPALLFGREQWATFVAAAAGRRAPAEGGNPSSSLSRAAQTSRASRASAAG
ncbi:MAG: DUF397 domain-containing protein [Trebonia sp.]